MFQSNRLLAIVCATLLTACSHEAKLTEVQRARSGDTDVVLLSADGVLHRDDPFTIEFRSADGKLVEVRRVRASASMPMPGMPMFGSIDMKPGDAPGRFAATAKLEMTGGWRFTIEWDQASGHQTATFSGTVQ